MTLLTLGYAVGGLAYSALECWLGKTEKVKAGSVLEYVYLAAKTAVTWVK